METKNGIRILTNKSKAPVIRSSVVKRVPLTASVNLDIVKSNHFVNRDAERGINGLHIAIEKALLASAEIVKAWQASGKERLEGVIKAANNMNIVFSIYNNQINKSSVDFVLQTIITKANFTKKNADDFEVIV